MALNKEDRSIAVPRGVDISQVKKKGEGPAMLLPKRSATKEKQASGGNRALDHVAGLQEMFAPPTVTVSNVKKRSLPDDGMSSSSSASGFSTPNIFKRKKTSPQLPPKPTTSDIDDRLLTIQETLGNAVHAMNGNSERIAVACEQMSQYMHAGTQYWKWVAHYMRAKLQERQQTYDAEYEDDDFQSTDNDDGEDEQKKEKDTVGKDIEQEQETDNTQRNQ